MRWSVAGDGVAGIVDCASPGVTVEPLGDVRLYLGDGAHPGLPVVADRTTAAVATGAAVLAVDVAGHPGVDRHVDDDAVEVAAGLRQGVRDSGEDQRQLGVADRLVAARVAAVGGLFGVSEVGAMVSHLTPRVDGGHGPSPSPLSGPLRSSGKGASPTSS